MIIMVIIYGLFIKDIDFTFNVKNPESAPSPIDAFNDDGNETASVDDESHSPAKVSTPDQADEQEKKTDEAADKSAQDTSEDGEEPLTEVVPLEPQVNKNPPDAAATDDKASEAPTASIENTPSLHYVYMDGFSSRESAEQAIQQLQDRKLAAQPYIRQHNGHIILQFGVFSDRENADAMAQQLRRQSVFVKVD